MICLHPDCTGVHDNNRFSELCPRSRALKAARDRRYAHASPIFAHRDYMAFLRGRIAKYGPDGTYAQFFGEMEAAEMRDHFEAARAGWIEKFRVARDGKRGTRRKPNVFCTGRSGVISVAQVLNYTRRPEIRAWYWL